MKMHMGLRQQLTMKFTIVILPSNLGYGLWEGFSRVTNMNVRGIGLKNKFGSVSWIFTKI